MTTIDVYFVMLLKVVVSMMWLLKRAGVVKMRALLMSVYLVVASGRVLLIDTSGIDLTT